jgi:hypothetical protein
MVLRWELRVLRRFCFGNCGKLRSRLRVRQLLRRPSSIMFFPSSAHRRGSLPVQKSILLAAIQKEIQRHDLSYFVSDPPSVAQGGRGVVVAGCPACRKRLNTIIQFLDHLTNDAMPPLIERLATPPHSGSSRRRASGVAIWRGLGEAEERSDGRVITKGLAG